MALVMRDHATADLSIVDPPVAAAPVLLAIVEPAPRRIGNAAPEDYTASRVRAAARLCTRPTFVITLIALAIIAPIVLCTRVLRRLRSPA